MPEESYWIEDVELEDVKVKWAFSRFDGRADIFNEEGQRSFVILLSDEESDALKKEGWNVKDKPGYEEGDPDEHQLDVKISFKNKPPKIFLIKNGRKMRAEERDLADIRRDTTEQIDVIITPYKWSHGQQTGVSAYVKELYAQIKTSRFSDKYDDYEEV